MKHALCSPNIPFIAGHTNVRSGLHQRNNPGGRLIPPYPSRPAPLTRPEVRAVRDGPGSEETAAQPLRAQPACVSAAHCRIVHRHLYASYASSHPVCPSSAMAQSRHVSLLTATVSPKSALPHSCGMHGQMVPKPINNKKKNEERHDHNVSTLTLAGRLLPFARSPHQPQQGPSHPCRRRLPARNTRHLYGSRRRLSSCRPPRQWPRCLRLPPQGRR